MNSKNPLISCLCVTYKRPYFLQRAIECFRNQTYKNRELVILYQDDDVETIKFIDTLKDENIRFIKVMAAEKLFLGTKRNMTVEACSGDYFCTWDDDDWSHPRRLELQLQTILANFKGVSVLINLLLYDSANAKAYLSFPWPWENTLMCSKHLFKEAKYDGTLNKREDSALMQQLLTMNEVCPLIKPTLYIYTFNGNNTWDGSHFHYLFSKSQKLPDRVSKIVTAALHEDPSSSPAVDLLLGDSVLRELNYFHSI